MTERKVLNKYFPPDYDPSKIPRKPKGHNNRVFNMRTMAPCNMRCDVCRVYIYRARKFNARVTEAVGQTYLGLRQYRFNIRCPSCCNEISWRSDIETNDYLLESGATRNFEALRTAVKTEADKEAARQEELANDPMKALEHRTAQSRNEMDILEALADIQQIKTREAGMEMSEKLLSLHCVSEEDLKRQQAAEDAALLQSLMNEKNHRRLPDSDGEEETSLLKKTPAVLKDMPVVPPLTSLKDKLKNSIRKRDNPFKGLVVVESKKQTSEPCHKANINEPSTSSSSCSNDAVESTNCNPLLLNYSDSD